MKTAPEIRLVALDMDGTTLGTDSKLSKRNAAALRAALDKGVQVVVATGKARPAVMHAMQPHGLCGRGGVVGPENAGIFLQGLAVYGQEGRQLKSAALDPTVVAEAFQYSLDYDLPLCAFLGDEIVTLKMHPGLEELHTVYHEPPAQVKRSIEEILAGPAVRKMLFMAPPTQVDAELTPYWRSVLGGRASLMQAVPDMLEIVPPGVNKGEGLRLLLNDVGVPASFVMACGDGGNDLELLQAAGLPIAMGNAVPKVKQASLGSYTTSIADCMT